MAANPWGNLGLDQIGELHIAVLPHLCEEETWFHAQVSTKVPEVERFWIIGSRGTNLLATLNDKGWKVENMP